MQSMTFELHGVGPARIPRMAPARATASPSEARLGLHKTASPSEARLGQHQAPVAERSDDELLAAMIDDRPWAWREFQRRYDRLIHRCITKVTRRFGARVSAEDVRDIYASLLLSLVATNRHKLRTFDPSRGNRFSSWIGLLAINSAYDYLRTMKREPNRGPLAEASERECTLPSPYDRVVESERAAIAARILESFSDKDRTFATLYFAEELEPQEIAERMNISVKTVYSKRHKIQSRLESVVVEGAASEGAELSPEAEGSSAAA